MKARDRLAQQARNEAVVDLIRAHTGEFADLHDKRRREKGLPPLRKRSARADRTDWLPVPAALRLVRLRSLCDAVGLDARVIGRDLPYGVAPEHASKIAEGLGVPVESLWPDQYAGAMPAERPVRYVPDEWDLAEPDESVLIGGM